MADKKTVETTFVGNYNDAGDDYYIPRVGDKSLAKHIATELKQFEGKDVKVTLTLTVEEK